MHDAAFGEIGIFRAMRDQRVERGGVGERAAQHAAVDDRVVAIGEQRRAGFGHQADLGHQLAVEMLGERGGRQNAHAAGAVDAAAEHEIDQALIVDAPASVFGIITMVVTPPAAAARPADLNVSLCSAPGSPMTTRMSIRPGSDVIAVGVDDLGAVGRAGDGADVEDLVGEQDRAVFDLVLRGVDQLALVMRVGSTSSLPLRYDARAWSRTRGR